MNAIEFAEAVEAEVQKLGPYRLNTLYDHLPPEKSFGVSLRVVRDPHHGETDFVVVGGKRIRRRAVETGFEVFFPMSGTAVSPVAGRFIDEELEPEWRSPTIRFEVPWPDAAEAAKDLDSTWVASRARKKLRDWRTDGAVTLAEPIDGFTQVSLLVIDKILREANPDSVGFRCARAAHIQLEEHERLSRSDGLKPSDLKGLVEMLGQITMSKEELLVELGLPPEELG